MSRTAGAAVVLLLALAGCAAADDGTAPAGSEPSPTVTSAEADEPASDDDSVTADEAEPAAAGPVITTTGSAYGTVLVDGRRQAIYLFDREAGRTPRCYGACADAWPPVLAKGDARARRQVRGGLLGTVPRRDGIRPGHLRRATRCTSTPTRVRGSCSATTSWSTAAGGSQ